MKILFVCAGNTCRSPMAQAIAHDALSTARPDIAVESAGVEAAPGRAAVEAQTVAAEHGLDLSTHLSQKLTPELAASADLVIGMEAKHVDEARDSAPGTLSRWESRSPTRSAVASTHTVGRGTRSPASCPTLPARRESSRARAERKRGISVPTLPCPALVISGLDFPDERRTQIAALYRSDHLHFDQLDHWGLVRDPVVPARVAEWLGVHTTPD